jgi:Plasmid stabilization system protein
MKRYKVVFSNEAIADIGLSYEWGCKTWGEGKAWEWYSDLRNTVQQLLGNFPLSQPVAPDNDEYDVEARQMIVGRYRVIFNVQSNVVTILHLRGPYTS